MEEMEQEVPEIRLCEVSNEAEAAMVVSLLKEEDIPARSDATASMPVFGGLAVRVRPRHLCSRVAGEEGTRDPLAVPSFQEPEKRPRARALNRGHGSGEPCPTRWNGR